MNGGSAKERPQIPAAFRNCLLFIIITPPFQKAG
jgi:hypothetical protein